MKPNLEIEYKTLLTSDEYKAVDRFFSFDAVSEIEQINIYFDDLNKTLFNKGMMCRVRLYNGLFEFTLKVPQTEGVLEYECFLDSLDLNHATVIEILAPHIDDVKKLVEVGRSTTIRKIHEDEYGQWCLDDNQFSHHHDYELEYELFGANDKAFDHFLKHLETLKITYKKAQPKYIRALQSHSM